MAKKKYMKNANGYGTVFKLSGTRRKSWVAKKFSHWEMVNGKNKAIYEVIGYYEDRIKAQEALILYNLDPYDLTNVCITFEQVYDKWSDTHFKTIVPSAVRTWKSAFNHAAPLHKMPMKDIRVAHLEGAINNAKVGASTKSRMKSMYNMMYRYAMKHEIVDKNYAELCFSVKNETTRDIVPFTNEEVKILWDNKEFQFVDMVLIDIYSGWRPQELCILKISDIDLDNNTMFGGLKTEAGKNRYVPIHPEIKELIRKRYNAKNEYLFLDEEGQPMTYDKYRTRWSKICAKLNFKHRPHECRHTFITAAKNCKMDEYVLKLIVGHEITDITERVYTHRQLEQLKDEMNKVSF